VTRQSLVTLAKISEPFGEISLFYIKTHVGFLYYFRHTLLKMAHYKGAASEGGRAQILIKKRQKEQEEMEAKRKKIEEELSVGSIKNKFATHYDAIEQQLKTNTIGKLAMSEQRPTELRISCVF